MKEAEFREQLLKVVGEGMLSAEQVDHVTKLAGMFDETPGSVSVYARLLTYQVPQGDEGKEVKLALEASNVPDVKIALATLSGASVKLIGTQMTMGMGVRKVQGEMPEFDEGQLDLERHIAEAAEGAAGEEAYSRGDVLRALETEIAGMLVFEALDGEGRLAGYVVRTEPDENGVTVCLQTDGSLTTVALDGLSVDSVAFASSEVAVAALEGLKAELVALDDAELKVGIVWPADVVDGFSIHQDGEGEAFDGYLVQAQDADGVLYSLLTTGVVSIADPVEISTAEKHFQGYEAAVDALREFREKQAALAEGREDQQPAAGSQQPVGNEGEGEGGAPAYEELSRAELKALVKERGVPVAAGSSIKAMVAALREQDAAGGVKAAA